MKDSFAIWSATFVLVFCLGFCESVLAQRYVIKSDDAKFVDQINGTKVIGSIAKFTPIYGIEIKDGWVKAVEPNSQTVGWLFRKRDLARPRKKGNEEEIRKRVNFLVKQDSRLWEYGKTTEMTPAQFKEIIEWADEIHNLRGDLHPVSNSALFNAGIMIARARDYKKAEQYFKKCLAISLNLYGKDAEESANVYLQLADLSVETGNFADAAKQAKKAAMINVEIYGEDHPKTLRAFVPLAAALYSNANYQSALGFYAEVAECYTKHYGASDQRSIDVVSKIAMIYEELGDIENAIERYETNQTALLESKPLRSEELLKTKLKLITLRLDPEDPESVQNMRLALSDFKTKFPKFRDYALFEEEKLVRTLLANGKLKDRTAALSIVDEGIRNLRTRLRKELWGIPAEKQSDYLSYVGKGKFFKAISIAVDFKDDPEAKKLSLEWLINAKGIVRETQSMQAGAEVDLAKRNEYASQEYVTLESVQKALPEKGTYVDIVRYLDYDFSKAEDPGQEERYAAWVVGKTGFPSLVELGRVSQIDRAIIELKKKLIETADQSQTTGELEAFKAVEPQLRAISDKIWEPIRKNFGESTIVVISPDQALWLLPWSAMLNPDGKFAIEQYQIQLELSGRELTRKRLTGANSFPAIFADPAYGEAREDAGNSANRGGASPGEFKVPFYGPLEFSSMEASKVKPLVERILGQASQLFLGEKALESSFKNLHSPSIVFLSTHGFFINADGQVTIADEQLPSASTNQADKIAANPLLQCGLMLANGNSHTAIDRLENDGVLTGAEIVRTDLKYTRLAVLSACETGVGSLDATGGVIGLTSAFHVAGAQCVVSSLWMVPDEDTGRLMKRFFGSLESSREVRTAMQAAQQEHIAARRKRDGAAHPYFWAAFNVSGEARF